MPWARTERRGWLTPLSSLCVHTASGITVTTARSGLPHSGPSVPPWRRECLNYFSFSWDDGSVRRREIQLLLPFQAPSAENLS